MQLSRCCIPSACRHNQSWVCSTAGRHHQSNPNLQCISAKPVASFFPVQEKQASCKRGLVPPSSRFAVQRAERSRGNRSREGVERRNRAAEDFIMTFCIKRIIQPQPISAAIPPVGNDSASELACPYRLLLRISCFTASYFWKRDYMKAEVAVISVWCDVIRSDIALEDTPAR